MMRSPPSITSKWEITMSTSDPRKAPTRTTGDPLSDGSLTAASAGMPDPQILAKIAGELFGALSGDRQAESAVSTVSRSTSADTGLSSLTLPSTGFANNLSKPGQAP